MVLGSLSSESVECAVRRAKFSETEDVTTTENTVECVDDSSGDAAEDTGECENHHRVRRKWSRHRYYDWQHSSEIVREPDYLKFLAEAMDINDEDECGGDQGMCVAPKFSDAVADESLRNAMSNSVIRFGSQSSNEPLWTESDLED